MTLVAIPSPLVFHLTRITKLQENSVKETGPPKIFSWYLIKQNEQLKTENQCGNRNKIITLIQTDETIVRLRI